jgi:predicted NACHT family NTPase
MTLEFQWKRFWCPRAKNFDLSDHGFLTDPDDKWGRYANPGLVTFERLAALPCAVMLGEPGIGKSWTLRQEYAEVERSLGTAAKSVFCDLRSFSTDGHLVAKTFESEVFESWRKGDWFLHVFLDSLDECLLRIDNVANILADELPKQPVNRLRLRVACRTASWPAVLEESLTKSFGDCNAHELVPLRRIDVQRSAEQSGITDPRAFLGRIDDMDVSSLAIKPATLKFLLSSYIQSGDLPKNHLELYEKGCRILVEENSPNRRSSGRLGTVSPDERLAVASRVAAVTQLCSRFAVFTGREVDGVPPEEVPLSDLTGGVERATDKVDVSSKALWEVLDTGLFSSRGVDRFGWAPSDVC